MEYLKDSTIPAYVLRMLLHHHNTVISRKYIMKYGDKKIIDIFAKHGVIVALEIKEPMCKRFEKKVNAKYPKEASYILTLLSVNENEQENKKYENYYV